MTKVKGTDPLGSLHHSMTLSSMDWGASAAFLGILSPTIRV